MHLAGTGEASNYGAEAAADNEPNLAKVQNYGAAIAQQPGDVRAQRLALATRNNPPVAAHDGDASDFAGLKRQAHKPPTGMRSRRRNRHIIALKSANRWYENRALISLASCERPKFTGMTALVPFPTAMCGPDRYLLSWRRLG
jgi:hypothetical protein